MNCTNCRYELSQCLDGRLPSGRRALVMQHVEQCGDCETFWNELQAAQRLVLQLPTEHVSDRFREQLWQRIQAGEGTPEAVFHEPVPMGAKVRYALTGAAAAALVLLGALSLRSDGEARQPAPTSGELVADGGDRLQPRTHDQQPPDAFEVSDALRLEQNPLFASTQPLTTDLVALEAARQLERRYVTVRSTLDRLQQRAVDPTIAVEQLLDNADEFHSLGDLLLEMRDRGRLVFTKPEVEADLQAAVMVLGQAYALRRDQEVVTNVVGQALQSRRLGSISAQILLRPVADPREEREVLVRLNHLRPEVFPKLFFVVGTDAELRNLGIYGGAFLMQDTCGTSWVAPRSVVEARDNLLRWTRTR